MSEYQYYEFVALDGAISDEGMKYAKSCSSRAEVSPLRWRNVYNFGDFHGSVSRLLQYYDAHFYTTNWGVTRFAVAFPEGIIDLESLQPYLRDDGRYENTLSVESQKNRTIIWWGRSEEEGWDWGDGDGAIGYLAGVRNEILQGDYRSLFIGWLAGFDPDEYKDSSEEDEYLPPVPSGMDMLNPALRALMEQFPVDQDVLAAVAGLSREFMSQSDTIEHILDPLSRNEMKALLERVAAGAGMQVMAELNNQAIYRGDDSSCTRMRCADFAAQVFDLRKVRINKEVEARAKKKQRLIAGMPHLKKNIPAGPV